MQLVYCCPRCQRPVRVEVSAATEVIECPACGWSRHVDPASRDGERPTRCLVCGCSDLWRQKDFPQKIGLAIVGLGILLSTVAWAYMRPLLAIGILMFFALADLALYTLMRDVLVCYRCGARHRHAEINQDHPTFDLEIAERHRQERKRLGLR